MREQRTIEGRSWPQPPPRSASLSDRFFYVGFEIEPDGCWRWLGSRHTGYGKLKVRGRRYFAHRLSYELHYGAIPDGMLIRHTCDNPICVNPDHLVPGSNLDNARDKRDRRRSSSFANGYWQGTCRSGKHEISSLADLYHHEKSDRYACRKCRADADRKSRERRRLATVTIGWDE